MIAVATDHFWAGQFRCPSKHRTLTSGAGGRFKLHNGSAGDVIVNNTVVKNGDALGIYSGVPVSRAAVRNNLLIGGPGGTYNGYDNGTGEVISVGTLTRSSLDYDALGSTTGRFAGRIGSTRFASLAELRARSSEKHAVQVALTSFTARIAYPARPMTSYAAPDLRLAATSQAVDAGLRMPGLTDGFVGRAPDIGAYERGSPGVTYGPRRGRRKRSQGRYCSSMRVIASEASTVIQNGVVLL